MKPLLTAAAAALIVVACSSGPEEAILQHYFTASRLRDSTTLAGFAAASFSPSEQGIVTSFKIVQVSPEQRKPLNIKSLSKAHEDARAQDLEFNKRKDDYINQHDEAIRRVLKAERENSQLKGKDAEVQAAWSRFREEGVQISRKVSDARRRLASETSIAEMSVEQPGQKIDLKNYDGELVSKDVTISAPVKLPSGQTSQKTLIVTMERAVLNGPQPITGRWIITSVKDTSAASATKTS